MSIMSSLAAEPQRASLMNIIVRILQKYNVRASEVLSARWDDFYVSQFLILRASKRSRDIVIRDDYILNCISHFHHIHTEFIFSPVTYNQLYHHIKSKLSHGFIKDFNKKNSKITHYYRYKNAQDLKSLKDVSTVLNHGSKHSAKYYNKQLKEE